MFGFKLPLRLSKSRKGSVSRFGLPSHWFDRSRHLALPSVQTRSFAALLARFLNILAMERQMRFCKA